MHLFTSYVFGHIFSIFLMLTWPGMCLSPSHNFLLGNYFVLINKNLVEAVFFPYFFQEVFRNAIVRIGSPENFALQVVQEAVRPQVYMAINKAHT